MRQRSRKQSTAGKKWRDRHKTGTGGKIWLMAIAPGGAMGLSKQVIPKSIRHFLFTGSGYTLSKHNGRYSRSNYIRIRGLPLMITKEESCTLTVSKLLKNVILLKYSVGKCVHVRWWHIDISHPILYLSHSSAVHAATLALIWLFHQSKLKLIPSYKSQTIWHPNQY